MHCSALFYEHNAHIHLILITVWGGFYYYVHFANEEIDTEKLSNLSIFTEVVKDWSLDSNLGLSDSKA